MTPSEIKLNAWMGEYGSALTPSAVEALQALMKHVYEAGQRDGEGYARQLAYNHFYGHEMGR